jgi:hypothetical protein
MVRRLAIVFMLVGSLAFTAGCSVGSQALGVIGCCPPRDTACQQVRTYARVWSRDMQKQQQFIDTYFFNYDVNDPYRCDCPMYDYCPCP